MINYYYAIWHKYKFKKLFSDLYTVKNFTLLRNPYYLLNFDFFGLPIKTDELLLKSFKNEIYNFINAFNGHYKLEYINADIDRTDESADMMSKLFKILDAANLLQKNYIIIDEYDHFANELLSFRIESFKAIVSKTGFVRKFFEKIKDVAKSVIDGIFITGVNPITLDSIASGFNIAMNITLESEFNSAHGNAQIDRALQRG